jgi:hypothetical protein
LRPDFTLACSIKFLLKIERLAGGFNFIQSGFEPSLNFITIVFSSHHL